MEAIWDDRKGNIEQIQTWLMETTDTFIIIQGPRGSGKKELVVDQALKHRKHKVVIDCKSIHEARGDSAKICAAAAEVGYRPVFSWVNSISGMIDLAAQGATGVKTGFSETVDSQLAKIWNTTATALRQIALAGRHKDDKDAHLGEDEYLEAHPEKRPVVVIDNFLHKSQEGGIVYDKIAEWHGSLPYIQSLLLTLYQGCSPYNCQYRPRHLPRERRLLLQVSQQSPPRPRLPANIPLGLLARGCQTLRHHPSRLLP